MIYYGTRLSENMSMREPEGYLLCLNVPVARSGTQEYLPGELGLPAGTEAASEDGLIPVLRPEEEVFSRECMSSFEGMPVTNDHPPDGVTAENIRRLQMGHAHNIRRGVGDESDLLLADLLITDPRLIELILHQGKREISCGYTYLLSEENGQFVQRQIRGNHVAVVDAGRAGPRVCIKDHEPKDERRKPKMKKSLYKKLVKMARDGDAEAMEAVQEIAEEILEEAAQDPTTVTAVPVAVPAVPVVAAPVAAGTGATPMAGTVAPVMAAPVAQATQAVQVSPVSPVAVPVAIVPEAATPENAVVRPEGGIAAGASEDEAGALGAILVKLDQLIDLLTPMAAKTGGAGDDEEPDGNGNGSGGNGNGGNSTGQNGNGGNEAVVNKNGGNGEAVVDPVEEIVQAIAEATEEVATGETAPAVAEAEAVAQIAEVVEAVVGKADDPDDGNAVSGVLEPEGEDECGDPEDNQAAGDALRAALTVIRPALAKMSKQQRMKVSADIAARMRKKKGKRTGEPMTPGAYVALAQARDRRQDAGDPRELGRKIMEKRNLNYQK